MKKTVVLLDDDADEEEILKDALQKNNADCEVVYFNTIKDALIGMTKILPDLVFEDMNMPRADGLEAIGMIRRNKDLLHVPLVLYSTGMSDSLCKKAVDAGASFCIKKTVCFMQLTKLIGKLLQDCGINKS